MRWRDDREDSRVAPIISPSFDMWDRYDGKGGDKGDKGEDGDGEKPRGLWGKFRRFFS
jgi:hypothetical protein